MQHPWSRLKRLMQEARDRGLRVSGVEIYVYPQGYVSETLTPLDKGDDPKPFDQVRIAFRHDYWLRIDKDGIALISSMLPPTDVTLDRAFDLVRR